jgi:methionyl-tRNA formyltransferase
LLLLIQQKVKNMAKIVFMGTPDFAVPALQALIEHHTVTAVVTQPDRPAGRGAEIQMSPIKKLALQHQIPVFQPEKISRKAAIEELRQWEADAYVVAAFGQILPQSVLDIPAHGSINIHASLLPRWRGAAPIHAAIRAGDARTGVTIMKMDAGLDTGPMLSVGVLELTADETGQSLHDKLATLGANLLIQTLPGYFSGVILPQSQPEEGMTYAPRIDKDEGRIDWAQDAVVIERLVRAFYPWPGTFTTWNGKLLKIISGSAGAGSAEPGRVIQTAAGVGIGTGQGLYYPMMVQLAGKKATNIEDFIRGYPELKGSVLEKGLE